MQVAREGKSDRLSLPRDMVEAIAGKIREIDAELERDRGDGKTIKQGLELFAEARDHVIREMLRDNLGEGAAVTFDDISAAIASGLSNLRAGLHREIERVGAREGYSPQRIEDLKLIADTGIGVAMTVTPGGRRRRGQAGRDKPSGQDAQDSRQIPDEPVCSIFLAGIRAKAGPSDVATLRRQE